MNSGKAASFKSELGKEHADQRKAEKLATGGPERAGQ